MAARRRRKTSIKLNAAMTVALVIIIVILAVLFALHYFGVITIPFGNLPRYKQPHKEPQVVSGELGIHFLELGNKYTGDCTYIKAGDTDILIDAGSRTNSVSTISSFINEYCTDGTLEYVIVTHAHQDHYAGFAGTSKANSSIFDLYECKMIIDFAISNNEDSAMYKQYQSKLKSEIDAGATHYTAADVRKSGNFKYQLSDGIELEILDSYFYYNKSSDENNYSVCCMINQGDKHFLFTGDLEKEGEEQLVKMNTLPEVELFKAGHHGSKTSSNDALLSIIKPKAVCVCCCAGSTEYTSANENTFPTQAFVDRVSKYTDSVYVTTICTDYKNDNHTSMNGNISVYSTKDGITFTFSNNDTKLKDTEWFKKYRKCPEKWSG